MAGFLGSALKFLVPAAQVIGPYQQANQLADTIASRRKAEESGVDSLLNSLGPEYESFRQARRAGMPAEEVIHLVGGPVGAQLRSEHTKQQIASVMNDPKLSRIDKAQRLVALGALKPEDFLKETKPEEPKGTFEQYVHDVVGMTPEQFRALPKPARDQFYNQFNQSRMPEGVVLVPTRDPSTGTNVTVPYLKKPTGLEPIPIGGAAGVSRPYTQGEERGIAALNVAKSAAQNVLTELRAEPTKKGVAGAYLEAGKYKLGMGGQRDRMLTDLGFAFQQLQLAAIQSGNVRAYQFIQSILFHLPHITDSDQLKVDKLNEFLRPGGFIDQADRILRSGAPSAMPAHGSSTEYTRPDGSKGRAVFVP